MANILFNIRKVKGNKPQMIYVSYRFCDDKLLVSTKLKALPSEWNTKKHQIRASSLCPDKDIINARLNYISVEAQKWLSEQKANAHTVNKDNLRAFLISLISPQLQNLNTLHGFIADFITRSENRTTDKNGKIVCKSTIYGYKRALKYIVEYEESSKKHLEFQDLGLQFYEQYTTFLQHKGLSANTVGREIKTIKIFLNDARKQGKTLNPEYLGGAFKVTKEESDNIYLTKEELNNIYALNLDNNQSLDRVRDLFLIGCYTGLRFSDYSNIKPINISEDIIKIRTQKTDDLVEIPLHPIVTEILNKYGGELPKSISNQKFNKQLGRIAKMCISGNEIKTITKGGKRLNINTERWKMVKSHTARRTFATNLYLSGYPAINIMKITGHKTENAFLKYIKVSAEMSAKMLRLHWQKQGEFIRIAKK